MSVLARLHIFIIVYNKVCMASMNFSGSLLMSIAYLHILKYRGQVLSMLANTRTDQQQFRILLLLLHAWVGNCWLEHVIDLFKTAQAVPLNVTFCFMKTGLMLLQFSTSPLPSFDSLN